MVPDAPSVVDRTYQNAHRRRRHQAGDEDGEAVLAPERGRDYGERHEGGEHRRDHDWVIDEAPVALVYNRHFAMRDFVELLLFVAILSLVIVYAWKKGVFVWKRQKTTPAS